MTLADEFQAAEAHRKAGDLAGAERGYRAVVAHADHLPSLNNLAVILERSGRMGEAGAVYDRAARTAPDDPRALAAYANHLRTTRRFAESETFYRRLLAITPDHPEAAFALGCVLLAQGRLTAGWPLFEARADRQRMLARGLALPEWRGEPLAGKRLLVWREQGFGDQIMMARFLAQLDAAAITYAGPPALSRLFAHLPVSFADAEPALLEGTDHDYWVLPMSLPHRLGATAQTLLAAPYLFGQARASGGRIGVVWRGLAGNRNDAFRSLPDEAAAPLLALPGAISLDPAATGAADFQATADIIAGLDLVITADTAAAHLAGAMGRPVWVMLAAHALDWHWPRQGASPWYPTARLFVQEVAGDWTSIVAAVCRAVAEA